MVRIERIDIQILEDRKFPAMTTLVLSLTAKSPSAGRSKTAPFGTSDIGSLSIFKGEIPKSLPAVVLMCNVHTDRYKTIPDFMWNS